MVLEGVSRGEGEPFGWLEDKKSFYGLSVAQSGFLCGLLGGGRGFRPLPSLSGFAGYYVLFVEIVNKNAVLFSV